MNETEKVKKLEIMVKELFLLIANNGNEPIVRRRRIDGYMEAKRLEFDKLISEQ